MPLHSKRGSCLWSSDDLNKWVVPDLSNVSEEEFQERLLNLKKSHQKLLELCDRVGIKERSSGEISHSGEDFSDFKKQNSSLSMSSDDSLSAANSDYLYQCNDKTKNILNFNGNSLRRYNSDELLSLRHDNYFNKNKSGFNLYQSNIKSRSLTGSDGSCTFNDGKSRITTCVPFNMTIREEERKRNNRLTRSKRQLEQYLKAKAELENVGRKKGFKALPIPPSTSENLFSEMQENSRLRKQRSLLKRSDFFSRTSRPFTFLEKQKYKHTNEYSEAGVVSSPKDDFKANPFPSHIFSKERDEKLRRIDILRQIRSAERSNRLLRSARSLSSMNCRSIKHKCHPPKQIDKKRSNMSGWGYPELTNSLELRFKPDVSALEFGYPVGKQVKRLMPTSQSTPHPTGSMFFDRRNHLLDGRHRNCSGMKPLESKPGLLDVKSRPKNSCNGSGPLEARISAKKRDVYWMDEKMKREIEAELEQITL